MNARQEKEVVNDLALLCKQPGYIHAVAYLCFRDNIVKFSDTLNADDLAKLSKYSALIRTEISTLIGLMVRGDIDFTLPKPEALQDYIDRTEALLLELHKSMAVSWFSGLTPEKIKEGFNPFSSAEAMREPIFYGGESAYAFQYRDLAPRKYAEDENWLRANKGFTIDLAVAVAEAICKLQSTRLVETRESMQHLPPEQWTMLPGFTFTPADIAEAAGLDESLVDTIVCAFALSSGPCNEGFIALNDFNETNARPIIPCGANKFVLLQQYSLLEALYETPFYWINSDLAYAGKAGNKRGAFAEGFSRERLERVFGKDRVYTNVDIYESKFNRIGEIDVLVLFGDRAIVLQAKSKRLTLEARKGNDLRIKDDFKKGIQESYDQGLICAKALEQPAAYRFLASGSKELTIPALTEIYILCVLSDHYPALAFQARQFLESHALEKIAPPYVIDVFTLDVMTEMLASPLRLLSYISRRCRYDDRIMAGHELTILSDHLKRNLWIDKKFDLVALDDNIAIDLDCAMMVRREGIPGKDTPDGILTRLSHTGVGRLITEIEHAPVPSMLSLGFMLLTLSEDCVNDVSKGIEHISRVATRDGKHHDLSISVREGNSGLTIHCNDKPSSVAIPGLQLHCEKRKYVEKAASWFGVCLSPTSSTPRFGVSLVYEWKLDERLESLTRRMGTPHRSIGDALKKPLRSKKLSRNDPCPCGSGKKYKKCCL